MNSGQLQLTGNVCAAISGLLYALPLQYLLHEFSRKRVDGGGILVGLLILIPLWLLLLIAVLCATAAGGFDWLRLSRTWLHALAAGGTLALAVVSFSGLEPFSNPSLVTRILRAVPIHLFIVITLSLVVLTLNPQFLAGLPRRAIQLPWMACAGLCLALCSGLLGFRLLARGGGRVAGLVYRIQNASNSNPDHLARIPQLDPQRDFDQLLDIADRYHSREVREAATARLRENPAFLETLAATLNSPGPGDGLEFVYNATLSPEELAKLAEPTRNGIRRFIWEIPAPNSITSDRRKQYRKWGREMLPGLEKKFAGTGVDFASAMPELEHALRPDDTRRR